MSTIFRDLRSNDLASVPYDLFHGLESHAQFDLSENPLVCSCALRDVLEAGGGGEAVYRVTQCVRGDEEEVIDIEDWRDDCQGEEAMLFDHMYH